MSDRAAVGLVGEGPAVEAVRAALADEDHAADRVDPAAVGPYDLVVAVGAAGDDAFERIDARRKAPWIAIELGGLGGVALDGLHGGVTVFGSGTGCYRCLATRVHSMLEAEPSSRPRVDRPDARLAGAHAGRLALDVLADEDRIGTIVELPYAERRLLPVPGCSCDPGQSAALVYTDEAVDLEATVGRAEQAVDARLGPIAAVGEAESFPAPYYLATLCDTRAMGDVEVGRQAAGVADDWNQAFVKAVGEALERYGAGVYRESALETAPAAELDDVIPPGAFVRPDDGYAVSDPTDLIPWVVGEDLHTGDRVHLPAEFVHFPPIAERYKPAITTGLGLGSSGAGALVSGLTEVLERDATMLAWYSTFEPLALAVDDPGFDVLTRRARAEELSVTALLVTQDVDVPVVTVAVHREGDWPRFAVGSGAALAPERAARSALAEALQNWMELRGMGPERAVDEEPTLARYAEFPPAARAFVDVDDAVPAADVGPDEPASSGEALPALLDRLATAGLDAFAARLTPRDVEMLGFEVVRVLVPAAQPLFVGERFFGDRARTVPRELGFRPRFDRQPHPYP